MDRGVSFGVSSRLLSTGFPERLSTVVLVDDEGEEGGSAQSRAVQMAASLYELIARHSLPTPRDGQTLTRTAGVEDVESLPDADAPQVCATTRRQMSERPCIREVGELIFCVLGAAPP